MIGVGIAHMVMPLVRSLHLAAAIVLSTIVVGTIAMLTIAVDTIAVEVGVVRVARTVIVIVGWLVSIKAPMGLAMAGLNSWARPREWDAIGLAGPGALGFTELAAFHQALDMMMVAVLGGPHLLLETEHLGPVFAERAVHVGIAAQHLRHPLLEGVQHQGVIPQVGGFQEVDVGMVRCHQLGVLADAADQDA